MRSCENFRSVENRIKKFRKERGMTLEQLAVAAGTSAPWVYKLESGQAKLTTEWLERFADAFGCDPLELIGDYGKNKIAPTVPLVGYVGAGGRYYPEPATGEWVEFARVERPPGEETNVVALRVVGKSMSPAYREGDIIYFVRDASMPIDSLVGKECIVQVRGAGAYVRFLGRGNQPGKWRLSTLDGRQDDDEVDIEWAAKVLWAKKA